MWKPVKVPNLKHMYEVAALFKLKELKDKYYNECLNNPSFGNIINRD